jgi:hypothetical protein
MGVIRGLFLIVQALIILWCGVTLGIKMAAEYGPEEACSMIKVASVQLCWETRK